MPTFTMRANELSGQTGLTVRIYLQGSSAIANGAGGDSLAETAASDGQFTATVAETLNAGVYEYFVYKSGSAIYRGIVNSDGSVLVADAPSVDPSEPGKRTGYLVCYDEDGVIESGVVVSLQVFHAPGTGLALDAKIRTETSNGSGVASFSNLIVGAKYNIWRGEGRGLFQFTVAAGAGSFEIKSIVGNDD